MEKWLSRSGVFAAKPAIVPQRVIGLSQSARAFIGISHTSRVHCSTKIPSYSAISRNMVCNPDAERGICVKSPENRRNRGKNAIAFDQVLVAKAVKGIQNQMGFAVGVLDSFQHRPVFYIDPMEMGIKPTIQYIDEIPRNENIVVGVFDQFFRVKCRERRRGAVKSQKSRR